MIDKDSGSEGVDVTKSECSQPEQGSVRLTRGQALVVRIRASHDPRGLVYDGNNDKTIRSLVKKGLLRWILPHREYEITDAGRAWVAANPAGKSGLLDGGGRRP